MTHQQELFFGVPVTTTAPEGVDFDGTYDYLSRATDLVGNVDSKTFTFSAWVYVIDNTITNRIIDNTNSRFYIQFRTVNDLQILGVNSAGTTILNVTIGATEFNNGAFKNGFLHILVSLDLNNAANRWAYINDRIVSMAWNTYTNDLIDFAQSSWSIGSSITASNKLKGRLSNVFLDYTYRDLSIEANRRLFIDANGKPADGWKALSPIIGMSMKDAATAHINDYGTGGNFTPNGTYATSNRGANQDNCVASYFDGVADYLSRTSLTGIADGKQFTLSVNVKQSISTAYYVFVVGTAALTKFQLQIVGTSIVIFGANAIGDIILNGQWINSAITTNRELNISIAIDMTDITKSRGIVNGVTLSSSFTTFTNDNIDLTTDLYNIAKRTSASTYFNGNIGELYFNTTYIDLATSNPFWDSIENKPIPVRKVIANTGVTPLIAMPLDASNAGKNYGTGGDFTVNSGPYVGARGASEFWARSVLLSYDSGAGNNMALNSVSSLKSEFSFVFAFKKTNTSSLTTTSGSFLNIWDSGGRNGISIEKPDVNNIDLVFYDNTYTPRKITTLFSTTFNTNYHLILISRNTTGWNVYVDGVVKAITYNALTPLDIKNISINCMDYLNEEYSIGFTYFTESYIDFSQESNRLKFVDGLGYPLDLAKQIDAGVIPKPLIYLPFNDTTNLGKNLGTGGAFTVNGTVTAGADVLG